MIINKINNTRFRIGIFLIITSIIAISSCQSNKYKRLNIPISEKFIVVVASYNGKEIYNIPIDSIRSFKPDESIEKKLLSMAFDSLNMTANISCINLPIRYQRNNNEVSFILDSLGNENGLITKNMLEGSFKIVHYGTSEMIKLSTEKTIILLLRDPDSIK